MHDDGDSEGDVSDETIRMDNDAAMALVLPEAVNGNGKSDKSSKMPVVLKTMTKKLIQKRKTIRRIEVDETHSNIEANHGILGFEAGPNMRVRAGGRSSNPQTSRIATVAPVSPFSSSANTAASRSVKEKDRNRIFPADEAAVSSAQPKGADLGRGLNKVLKRAKNPFKSGSQAEESAQARIAANLTMPPNVAPKGTH